MTNHPRISAIALTIITAAMLVSTRTASASPITFTGNTSATILSTVAGGLTFNSNAINLTTDAFGNSDIFSLGSFSIDTTKNYSTVSNAASLSMNLGGNGVVVDTFDVQISNYQVCVFTCGYWRHDNTIFGSQGFQTANPGSPSAPEHVTYTNDLGSGSFNLTLLGYPQFETLFTGDWGWKAAYYSDSSINAQITNAQFTPSVAPAPEPSSLLLLGTGILGLAGVVRRRLAV